MRLQEAIQNGQTELATCAYSEDSVWLNTVTLLIKAGEEIQALRRITVFGEWELLPGETLE